MKNHLPSLLFATLFLMVACGAGTEKRQNQSQTITLQSYTEFPSAIDGCACYFSRNEADFKAGKYIYTDNYQDQAFLKIGDEIINFQLSQNGQTDQGHTVQSWTNKEYQLDLDYRQTGQIDETWQQRGELFLTRQDGARAMVEIVGECGC